MWTTHACHLEWAFFDIIYFASMGFIQAVGKKKKGEGGLQRGIYGDRAFCREGNCARKRVSEWEGTRHRLEKKKKRTDAGRRPPERREHLDRKAAGFRIKDSQLLGHFPRQVFNSKMSFHLLNSPSTGVGYQNSKASRYCKKKRKKKVDPKLLSYWRVTAILHNWALSLRSESEHNVV